MARQLRSASAKPANTIPNTVPATPVDDIPTEWAMSVWVDKHGNRYYFKEEEMVPENPAWHDLISAIITPPKPALRPVDRFWIHQNANPKDPVYFDDDQIVAEAATRIRFELTPEEAAEKLGYRAEWYVVEPITYEDDGVEFIKNEPVEEDDHWFPATEEEIATALAEKAEKGK